MNLLAIRPVLRPDEEFREFCKGLHYIPVSHRLKIKREIKCHRREIDRLQCELKQHRVPNENDAEALVSRMVAHGAENLQERVNDLRTKGWSYCRILSLIESIEAAGHPSSRVEDDFVSADYYSLDHWEQAIKKEEQASISVQENFGVQYGVPEPWRT